VKRTLLLSLLVVGAAVALVIGSYSALAGAGPVTSVAGAVIGAEESDDVDVLDAVETDDVDGDDVDGQDDVDGNDGEGEKAIAQVIADEFEVSPDEVLALREQGIGFGAIFKLYALGVSIPTDADGDYEFNFGELRKALSEDQQAVLESGPKNLGKLVSAAHHEDNGGGAVAQGGGQGNAFGHGHGQGKPQGVPPDGDSE